MAKKYEGICSDYIERYLKKCEKAKEAEEDIQVIREKYDFDKKEALIKEVSDCVSKSKFLDEFASVMRTYISCFMSYNLIDDFSKIIAKFGGDVDEIEHNANEVRIYKYCDKNVFYFYDTCAVGMYETEEIRVLMIPVDCDLPSLFDELESLYCVYKERYDVAMKEKEEKEAREKAEAERREYAEFLRLKKKYEG